MMMKEKIQIKSIYGNKFIVEKGKTESPDTQDELYHVIFDNEKGFVLSKEEAKKLKNFFEDLKIE